MPNRLADPVVLLVGDTEAFTFTGDGQVWDGEFFAPHLIQRAHGCERYGVATMMDTSGVADFISSIGNRPLIIIFFLTCECPEVTGQILDLVAEMQVMREVEGHLVIPYLFLNRPFNDLDHKATEAGIFHIFLKRGPREFMNALHQVSRTMELYLEAYRARQEVLEAQELAHTDDLTGLGNKRAFKRNISEAISRAVRNKSDLSIVYFDLNELKRLNDTLGHLVGDAALQLVSNVARKVFKFWVYSLYRLGGDEFMVILPGANLAGAEKLAAHFERSVLNEQFHFQHQILEWNLSATAAAAQYVDGESLDELIARVDKKMYERKPDRRTRLRIDETG